MVIKCYTDGSCSGNPGIGGCSSLIRFSNTRLVMIGGNSQMTTNNEMELTAFNNALSYIKKFVKSEGKSIDKIRIDIYSDSAYIVNSINQGWIENWERNGWINRQNQPVKNMALWKEVIKHYREIVKNPNCKVNILKVKGHSGHKENDLVDKFAKHCRDRKLEFVKEFPSSKELEIYADRL